MPHSEAELSELFWWWTRNGGGLRYCVKSHSVHYDPTPSFPLGAFSYWKDAVEPAAYTYELARRHDRDRQWLPWIYLRAEVRVTWQFQVQTVDRKAIIFAKKVPDLGPTWGPLPAGVWNYRVPWEAVAEELKKKFLAGREARRLPRTRSARARRTRSISWRSVELLDVHYFKIRALTGRSERWSPKLAEKQNNTTTKCFDS